MHMHVYTYILYWYSDFFCLFIRGAPSQSWALNVGGPDPVKRESNAMTVEAKCARGQFSQVCPVSNTLATR